MNIVSGSFFSEFLLGTGYGRYMSQELVYASTEYEQLNAEVLVPFNAWINVLTGTRTSEFNSSCAYVFVDLRVNRFLDLYHNQFVFNHISYLNEKIF